MSTSHAPMWHHTRNPQKPPSCRDFDASEKKGPRKSSRDGPRLSPLSNYGNLWVHEVIKSHADARLRAPVTVANRYAHRSSILQNQFACSCGWRTLQSKRSSLIKRGPSCVHNARNRDAASTAPLQSLHKVLCNSNMLFQRPCRTAGVWMTCVMLRSAAWQGPRLHMLMWRGDVAHTIFDTVQPGTPWSGSVTAQHQTFQTDTAALGLPPAIVPRNAIAREPVTGSARTRCCLAALNTIHSASRIDIGRHLIGTDSSRALRSIVHQPSPHVRIECDFQLPRDLQRTCHTLGPATCCPTGCRWSHSCVHTVHSGEKLDVARRVSVPPCNRASQAHCRCAHCQTCA